MMLRDEPKVRYYYEDLSKKKGQELKSSDKEDLDPVKYKFIYKYRSAFIGNMQSELNKVFNCDLKERWVQSIPGNIRTRVEYRAKYITINPIYSFLNNLRNKWLSLFQKKEKDDLYLENLIEQRKNGSHIEILENF